MRFRISYGIAFGIFGLLILASALWFWRGAFGPVRPELAGTPQAVVSEVRGEATLTRAGVEQPVVSGIVVQAGDDIATGEAATVAIHFFDSTRTALDANSRLQIGEARIAADAPARQNVRVVLLSGRVWSRILKLLDGQSTYGVEVNGVVSGVRGTAYAVTARGRTALVDVYDGAVGVSGKTAGSIPEGFSAAIDTAFPPTNVDEVLVPTPDSSQNDSWIQEQLDDDALFAQNVIPVRAALGVKDAVGEYKEVQRDADSGVLIDPGVEHSDFQRVEVVSPQQVFVVRPGQPVALRAFGVFERPNGTERRDVTDAASWQVSHPDRARVDRGVVTVAAPDHVAAAMAIETSVTLTIGGTALPLADGSPLTANAAPGVAENAVVVVARWHDGTHAHSAAVTLLLER